MELKKIVWFFFIATLLLDTITFSTPSVEPTVAEETTPQPPVDFDITKQSSVLNKPLVIEYCVVCSYKSRVDELKNALKPIYPSMVIIEENHPTPFPWPLISSALTYIKYSGIALLVAGDQIFGYLQMNYPPWYLFMKNNKMAVGAGLFLGLDLLNNWTTANGAFEVYYDGAVVYSGLKMKRIPSVNEIIMSLGEIANS